MWSRGLAPKPESAGLSWPWWAAGAGWAALTLAAPFLLSRALEQHSEQHAARAWLESADRLTLALEEGGAPGAARQRAGAPGPSWLHGEAAPRALLDAVPLPPEAMREARAIWAQAVARLPSPPSSPPSAPGSAAEQLQGAVSDVAGAVRERVARSEAHSALLGSLLFAGAGAQVLGLAALGVLRVRGRARTRAAQASRAALALSEARLRALVQTAQDLIWAVDADGRWIFVNEAVRRIYGYAPEELLGRPFEALVAPERAEADEAVFRDVLAGKTVLQHQTVHLRKDGRPVTLLFNATALRDPSGRPVGTAGSAADVSSLVEMRARVCHTDRVQALGVLAGSVAHDFNNLLTGVIGNAGFAREDRDDPTRLSKDLDAIEAIAQRGRTLTRQLLAFARRQVLKPEVLDLVRVAREQHDFLGRLLGEDVTLRTEAPPHPLWVRADRTQLEQVLMNLCVNARDALRSGRGRITVTVGTTQVGAAEAAELAIEPGSWVRLDVEDDGLGMDPETRRHMFEPFFTTKVGGKGTGLGLSTVHGIVHQHGGTITVDSSPGRGTLMRVLLQPSAAPSAVPPVGAREATPAGGAGVRVLVVEDDRLVREVVQRVLVGAGFEVDAPAEPLRALEALRGGGQPPDILVADVRMPGISGPQLAVRLRTVRPDLPVLFMSGYAGRELPARWLDEPHTRFLRKPFTPLELLALIDTLRRRARGGAEVRPAASA